MVRPAEFAAHWLRSRRRERPAPASGPACTRASASAETEISAGVAVHTGARVAALAAAGEVLVSRTVKDLVADSGLRFEDRGTRTLKGVPDEWQLYAVTG
jgi:class 3 adenylate cyclase